MDFKIPLFVTVTAAGILKANRPARLLPLTAAVSRYKILYVGTVYTKYVHLRLYSSMFDIMADAVKMKLNNHIYLQNLMRFFFSQI